MHRLSIVLSLAVALVVALVGSVLVGRAGLGASAQEATPAALADHPIVGAWHWDNDPADPADDSYGVFHADGTYLEVTRSDNAGTGVGVWEATGERSADVLFVFQDIDPSAAFAPGTATFLLAVTVDETEDALIGSGALQVRPPDGTLTFEADGFAFTADRVVVAPLPDFGTPAAGTSAAATPAP